ncbi:barstar family protein [Streptomyces sp. NPDC050439]|uniref:barstar family protein n=1 Tax=unclassified Streptomyces TaxID=2593676 RepID=UPI003443BFE7
MDTGATLTRRRSPWVVFARHDDPWLSTETAELQKLGGRVIHLDGRELSDPPALFAAFARELSFPAYFGHNWDALVDCLHDWHGHGGETKDVAVLIDHADDLLGADFLGLFVSVLCQAAWQANLQLDADGAPNGDPPPHTLHFAFVLDTAPPTAFAEPAASGMDVSVKRDEERLTATSTGEDWPEADRELPSQEPRNRS